MLRIAKRTRPTDSAANTDDTERRAGGAPRGEGLRGRRNVSGERRRVGALEVDA